MRLWIFSDLHLDVNAAFGVHLPAVRPAHDAVVIAGDLCEGIGGGIRWIVEQNLNVKPVIYVPGNHEFYGRDHSSELSRGREAARAHGNIYVLDRDHVQLDDLTILGATLWTDYDLYQTRSASMGLAERLMSDHRMIADGDRAFSATSARREHVASRLWLETALPATDLGASRTIVVTHHAPSERSISARFQGHPLTASFTSNLDHLLPRAALWVHGHTHRAISYDAGTCRVVNNPLGYLRHERTGFVDDLVIEV